MPGRNIVIFAVALFVGLIAVVVANGWFSGMEARQERVAEKEQLARIVVATQPLAFGDQLTQQNVRLQNWPASSVPEGAFTSIPAVLRDKRVALRPIVAGEPILASKVSGTDGRATLAAVLPEGMRAFSIPVSAVSGVSGFVLPGTMVDVILTRKIAGDGAESEDIRSDVILENVQVLAVDQNANDGEGKPDVSKTATLAVPLYDAQRLSIARRIGTLSLALRRIEGPSEVNGNGSLQRASSTVTNRQLGGRMMYVARLEPGQSAPVPNINVAQSAASSQPGAPVYSGPTMSVIRGTQSTEYPISYLGGW